MPLYIHKVLRVAVFRKDLHISCTEGNILGFTGKITVPGEASNRVTSLGVTELGWVTNIVYPNGQSETFTFDPLGNET